MYGTTPTQLYIYLIAWNIYIAINKVKHSPKSIFKSQICGIAPNVLEP